MTAKYQQEAWSRNANSVKRLQYQKPALEKYFTKAKFEVLQKFEILQKCDKSL